MFLYSTVSTLKPATQPHRKQREHRRPKATMPRPIAPSPATRTNGRDGGHNLAKLELVQDGGLAGGIETDHENAHLLLDRHHQLSRCDASNTVGRCSFPPYLLAEHARPDLSERRAHGDKEVGEVTGRELCSCGVRTGRGSSEQHFDDQVILQRANLRQGLRHGTTKCACWLQSCHPTRTSTAAEHKQMVCHSLGTTANHIRTHMQWTARSCPRDPRE